MKLAAPKGSPTPHGWLRYWWCSLFHLRMVRVRPLGFTGIKLRCSCGKLHFFEGSAQ